MNEIFSPPDATNANIIANVIAYRHHEWARKSIESRRSEHELSSKTRTTTIKRDLSLQFLLQNRTLKEGLDEVRAYRESREAKGLANRHSKSKLCILLDLADIK